MAEFERMELIDFRRHGYLFLLDLQEDVVSFREALALQQRLGVPSREVSVEEALGSFPARDDGAAGCDLLRTRRIRVSESVVQWYAARARRAAGLRRHRACAWRPADRGVETSRGADRVRARSSVARRVVTPGGGTAGVELPVEGEKRWIWFSPRTVVSRNGCR
jgi:sarcosine oxidase subunit beta